MALQLPHVAGEPFLSMAKPRDPKKLNFADTGCSLKLRESDYDYNKGLEGETAR